MNAQDKTAARAAIERAEKIKFITCPTCEGYGSMLIGIYKSDYASCKTCKGIGCLKRGDEGLIPELAAHLKAALARIDELENEKKHLAAQVLFRLGIGE